MGKTYRDFGFDTEVVEGPTATKGQSKLWFAAGTWWAGLVQPATNRQTIFRLDEASQIWHDTGTLIDERPFVDSDFLWTGEHLYVVTAGPHAQTRHHGRILRYSLDTELGRFAPDPNFPVTIIPTGTTAAVVSQDSTGMLWVAYAAAQRIWVVHSLDNDAHWSEPMELPVAPSVRPDDIASVVAYGPGLIGVMWSAQQEDRVYFSSHRDGDPAEAWSEPEIVVDGPGSTDDHINLKAFPDGDGIGVVAALKTGLDQAEPINPLAPLILLAVRRADTGWETHLVSRVQDRHTRPIVLVDPDARLFYVAATSPGTGGEILYKRTSMDDIVFDTGRGERLVASELDRRINNATSAKHGVSAETGLLVMASDNESGRYLHSLVDLGGGMPAADPADPARLEPPAPPADSQPITLLHNEFQAWPVGPATGTGWAMREGDPTDALAIVDDGGRHGLELAAIATGPSVRACRQHPEALVGNSLEVGMRVSIEGLGASDATIASLRGSGGEAVSIRVTSRGTFAWFDGETKMQTDIVARPGTDYGLSIDVDQASRTFDVRIVTVDGAVVIERTGVAWRSPDVLAPRSVCMETSSGASDQRLRFERVRVLEIQAP